MTTLTATTYLKPATAVKLGKIDTEGLWGRDPHPPVTREPGQRPSSQCDGQVAYVADYVGWDSSDGTTERLGEFTDVPEVMFNNTPVGWEDEDGPRTFTHYYRLVVPGIGVYEFADYEIAEVIA